jgi:HD-GYP domain-containing protein (c-di-GMP phosphodiesterase class II)
MAASLLVTPEVAGRTSRPAATVAAGTSTSGSVVLTTPAALKDWPAASFADTLWVVIGDGTLPPGCRPFLVLGEGAGISEVDRAVAAALEVAGLRERVDAAVADAGRARERQLDLARVGIALTAERDLDRLLELILQTARDLVNADAGSVFLVVEDGSDRRLHFAVAQNDSVPATFSRSTVALDSSSLAGHAAVSGAPIVIEDVRRLPPDVPFRFNDSFDRASGYHTRSVLATPMATRAGEVVGALQLINRKIERGTRVVSAAAADAVVRPFGAADVELIRALAAQAAVAIENTRLVKEIEGLFEGFVRASVMAIEQRDPSTSGHSLRVARYAVGLAKALAADPESPYRGARFGPDELTELRYAAVLHDFGKVGVREAVLTKAKKLLPERLAAVHERFRHARAAREAEMLRALVRALLEQRRPPTRGEVDGLDAALHEAAAELSTRYSTVLAANEPAPLPRETGQSLGSLARVAFRGADGTQQPLLLPEEVRALSVSRGSLDEEERREIESHAVHSYQFLLTLPWPRRFARVAEIAYGHHEKLNGRGYPGRLAGEQIPLEARILAVCDIFDALAAGDRPYKRAMSIEDALAELEREARDGLLDQALVRTFISARVYAGVTADPLAL